MDKQEKNTFSYSYNANQQEEVKKIREKYVENESDKLELLRRLDAGVTQKANTMALIIGVIGTLVMGCGMSLCMTGPEEYFIHGVVIGVIGIAAVSLAYPIYSAVLKKERKKAAPEIIRLTDELMK